jgi:hypothetical protein
VLIRAIAVVSCLLLAGACTGETEAESPTGGTVLAGLTPERLCALLPVDTIEQTLDVVVTDTKSRQSGRPPILSKTCRYEVEFALADVELLPPAITVDVKQTRDKGIDETLDHEFTDLMAENAKTAPYERVDGLGEAAGYGDNPTLGSELPESQLVVVFTAGGERFAFDVSVSPHTPVEKLTPLATDLLGALEAEFG